MALKEIGSISIGRPDNECKLKIGTGVGSQHLFLKNEYGEFFEDIDDFFFYKKDLINYLFDAKEEFFHPSESYHFVRIAKKTDREQGITSPTVSISINLSQYWNDLIQEINDLEDISYLGFIKGMDNDNAGRFYYHNDNPNSPYTFLYRICIPTKQARSLKQYRSIYKLIKLQDTITKRKYIHIIPIFNMSYSEEQLSGFLKRDLPNEDEKQKCFMFDFFFKYADFIKRQDYSIREIIEKAGIDITYLDELEIAVTSFSKNISDIKNIYQLSFNSKRVYDDGDSLNEHDNPPIQQIFYGSPGSGKSHTIRRRYEQDTSKVIRTTFHPDTDYATFVGCYKPITYNKDSDTKITYDFVPQAFTDAYVKAWNDRENQYILIIEEINRGNCAQIFGDLFQLLDRNKQGYSDYPINADKDLCKYLQFGQKQTEDGNKEDILKNKDGIKNGKLCLPPNLSIVASMNTSDQSLFPMDSAFKRRWAWEYVPIDYENIESGIFTITIGNRVFQWHDFLRIINDKIKKVTSSEDKQMGNFFIKHSIDEKEFKDKVLFYLWSEVGKDNYQTNDALFHCYKPGTKDKIEFSFNELYASDSIQKLQDFMDILGEEARSKNYPWTVEKKEAASSNDEPVTNTEEELGR